MRSLIFFYFFSFYFFIFSLTVLIGEFNEERSSKIVRRERGVVGVIRGKELYFGESFDGASVRAIAVGGNIYIFERSKRRTYSDNAPNGLIYSDDKSNKLTYSDDKSNEPTYNYDRYNGLTYSG